MALPLAVTGAEAANVLYGFNERAEQQETAQRNERSSSSSSSCGNGIDIGSSSSESKCRCIVVGGSIAKA
ncbi:hypothetical protein ACLKA7_003286 [Drosophila subpalustris]